MENKKVDDEIEHDCTKLDLLLINNGWNDNNETLIVSIGENASAYKWMHEKSNSKYTSYDQLLNVIIIIFNTILTTQTFITIESNIIEITKKNGIFNFFQTYTHTHSAAILYIFFINEIII